MFFSKWHDWSNSIGHLPRHKKGGKIALMDGPMFSANRVCSASLSTCPSCPSAQHLVAHMPICPTCIVCSANSFHWAGSIFAFAQPVQFIKKGNLQYPPNMFALPVWICLAPPVCSNVSLVIAQPVYSLLIRYLANWPPAFCNDQPILQSSDL